MIYTHNPDNLTSLRPILSSGKRIIIRDGDIYESVKGNLYPFDADVYIRHFSCDMVGYRSEKGNYMVIEKDGLLGIVEAESPEEGLMRVDLYQDIRGEYFPIILDPAKYYKIRPDERVEEITIDKDSSSGRVVENVRGRIG